MITALDHLVLVTPAIEPAIAAYTALLGRAPSWALSEDGAAKARFDVGNTALELMAPDGGGPMAARLRAVLDEGGERLTSLCFRVEDATAVHRRLERRGLDPEAVVESRAPDPVTGAMLDLRRTRANGHGVKLFFLEETPRTGSLPMPGPAAMTGLDHVVVTTPDPERAAALYGARLGLDMALDRTNPQWGSRLMFFRCGDLIIEVMHNLKTGLGTGPDQLWGLSWRSDDVAATRARLSAAGLDVSELRTGRKPGTKVFSVRNGTCNVPTLVLGKEAP